MKIGKGVRIDVTCNRCRSATLIVLPLIVLLVFAISACQKKTISMPAMIEIPAGPALVGGSCGSTGNPDNAAQRAEHTVDLPTFFIDRLPVTRDEYRRCIEAGGCPSIPERLAKPSSIPPGNHPALVSYQEAEAYCRWAGKRLPTEDEWEKAARGSDGRIYPWGNDLSDNPPANFCDEQCGYPWREANVSDGYNVTSPVGAFPEGASPYGVLDMAGNVKQWVTPVGETLPASHYLARGSSWYSTSAQLTVCNRHIWQNGIRLDDKGFRCVRD